MIDGWGEITAMLLRILRTMIYRITLRLRGELTLDGEITIKALVKAGLKIGHNCHILPDVTIDSGHCWLVELGNNVTLAPEVYILAHDASTKLHLGYTRIGKVKIGDNVFVGARTIIMPNVTIGANSIIGAGSLVNQDIPAHVVAAGNPAKVISTLEAFLDKHRQQMEQLPCFDASYTVDGGITPEMKAEMLHRMVEGQGYVV